MTKFDFDLFTIGGGSGGVRASRFAAKLGARVALAEGAQLGGTCVNVGCIPKKLMSMAAHFHEDYEDAVGFGWQSASPGFDWATLIANKDREIARLNGVYANALSSAGVTLIEGWAQLVDAQTVQVNGKRYSAQHILIATGGKPLRAPVPGHELAITSDEFFHLPRQPLRAVVHGGGYIAVELASILNGLGTHTTLVHRGPKLIKEFDADLGVHLGLEMQKRGVVMRLNSPIERITPASSATTAQPGELTVQLASGDALAADCVLFATGRSPNVQGLGLDALGVKLIAKGAIEVDANLRSSVPSIFAIGDVIDRLALTPVATSEGMVVAEFLFGQPGRSTNYPLVPTAVFSHPNVGTVGLSEEHARQKGHDVQIFRSSFTPLRHTLSQRNEKALLKLVVDSVTDRVLGVHLVCADAGEVLQGFAVALTCGATKSQFDATIGIHPTLAEELVTMREPVATN